jgi:protoheme IX farnesyltransferase
LGVNLLTGLLGLFTLLSIFSHTPLKQRSPHSTTVGRDSRRDASPLIGGAASGRLTREAWILYAILFLWQFPHFYAIAWMYRDDYARAHPQCPGGGASGDLHRAAHSAVQPGGFP